VGGLTEASVSCRAAGVRFVAGIELEVESETGEFHLLGLGFPQWDAGWVEGLAELQNLREQRNLRIFDRMNEAGIKGSYDEVRALSEGGQVGRPHFARFLVNRGKVATIQDAFTHFLGRGQLFYEKKAALPLDRALSLVHGGGALALVAHPLSLQLKMDQLEAKLAEWKAQGLDGIEAWHPGAEPRQCRRLEEMAVRCGLKVSAGSDFHGDNRPDRKLGLTAGARPIDDRFLEELFS
jgi:3',5'-nucleoside bisphosphate phosphatase